MGRLQDKTIQKQARIRKVRAKINGTSERPRLAINVSNIGVSAQLIDDENGKTLTSVNMKADKKPMMEVCVKAGEDLAAAASKAGIKEAVADRRGKKYHGRIKALCEAANEKGLKV